MNINRHNYEEYFILYLDNELVSDDRRMVEAFVQNHPDLKEELEILQQFKLVPDTDIVFTGKEELMMPVVIEMPGNSAVNPANYEEWLVLYTDNELTADQRTSVEYYVAANPSAKKELAHLQQSKLQPEEIIFADKKLLYREEEKVRAMPVRWWRMAAAAVLLLGIGITTLVVINDRYSGGKDTAKNNTPEKKINTKNPLINPEKINNQVNETVVADNTVKQILSPDAKQPASNNIAVKENKNKVTGKFPVKVPDEIKNDVPVIVKDNNDKPSNKLPQPLNTSDKDDAIQNAITNADRSKKINTSDESLEPPVTIPAAYPSDSKNSDVSFTNFEEGGKNKKNRGFFRKVARTFEKRTNIDPTDDGKLLVGGLAIKLR